MYGITENAMEGLKDERKMRKPLTAIVAPKMEERIRV